MNQKICSGLTIALLTTAFGTASASYAESNQPVNLGSQANLSSSANLAQVKPTEIAKVGQYQSETDREVIAKIHTHEYGKYQAATLFVRSIPVLTFLGSPSLSTNGFKMGETNDPVARATKVATKLNQLSQINFDAKNIDVSWKENCNCYAIRVDEQELVEINDKTILPDTTRNIRIDALQATNRLRRIMGNAAPLKVVANLPKQKLQQVSQPSLQYTASGMASWYGGSFHGGKTASGERFNQYAMTAAHRRLPFGTKVRVTNLNNGRSVVVRITDRGPFIRGRVIDVSIGAASVLGMVQSGVAPVQIDVLGKEEKLAADR